MASTETRTGFRLPWVSDAHATADAAREGGMDESPSGEGQVAADSAPVGGSDTGAAEMGSSDLDPLAHVADSAGSSRLASFEPAPVAAPRRPTKFLADLARAMRAAAETERQEILDRFRAEAKTFVETIHERSAAEATELRSDADGDIGGIRDWSKAEIARVREETERRITERHSLLDREIEQHAARIERRIELVNGTVVTFEGEMSRFFEALLAEEDPTRFAALAANLPEPPSLDAIAARDIEIPAPAEAVVAAPEPEAESVVEPEPEPDHEAEAVVEPEAEPEPEATSSAAGEADGEDAAAAGPSHTQPVFDEDGLTLDPRVAALGLTPDFGAAEAEAAAMADLPDDGSSEEVPAFDEETIASRLAGLVPAVPASTDTVQIRVLVSGLVSVASIAGFKRGLSRLPGVQSVSVSSGPDGEFVFAAVCAAGLDLAGAITTMQGFSARVTSASDDRLEVAAHDPDAA